MEACDGVRKELLKRAGKIKNAPLNGAELADVTFVDGEIRMASDPSRHLSLAEVLRGVNEPIVSEVTSMPDWKALGRYSHKVHSAVFAEVRLDEELGMLRVARVVSAVAAGRILNAKTAHSQIMGAVVGGIGMALHEETVIDHRYGRFINHNFAEYHVPVNADIHDIDVIFVDEVERSSQSPRGEGRRRDRHRRHGRGNRQCGLSRDRRAGARSSHHHRQTARADAAPRGARRRIDRGVASRALLLFAPRSAKFRPCTRSRRFSTRCKAKARRPAGLPCSAALPAAICGRAARLTARPRPALSATPTSSARMVPTAANSPTPMRSPQPAATPGGEIAARLPSSCSPAASRCCKSTSR